ncbi:hypothetical protein ACEPAG_6328 [Sanghuangporus baumii]
MHIVGLKAALNSNNRYKYRVPEFIVDHLVIGGGKFLVGTIYKRLYLIKFPGVVGLAIARALAVNYPDKTTYLVERNGSAGEETSSRNSEVIHAGLYYPTGSLKESLCIRGRHLLYQYCDASSVPYRKTGKLVVATESQRPYIESLYSRIESLEWPAKIDTGYPPSGPPIPAELISGSEARDLEPDLSPDISAALLSHETGIVDSHTLMESLEKDVTESENGELVYSTSVVRVDPYRSRPASGAPDVPWNEEGWVIQMVTRSTPEADSSQGDAFLARNVVNASGLSANLILNSLLPPEKRIPMYYSRGSYAAYNGPGVRHVKRLLYPCPDTGKKGKHAFQSLGTHLTLDLNGNIKFGPDLQWISPSGASLPNPGATPVSGDGTSKEELFSYDENDVDFWKQYLIPDDSQIAAVTKAVKQYLPGADESKFRPDYVGIRPKLVPPWGGFQDFVFRRDRSTDFLEGSGSKNKSGNGEMITLLGIESPGLTASLAIAEKVIGMLEHNNDY